MTEYERKTKIMVPVAWVRSVVTTQTIVYRLPLGSAGIDVEEALSAAHSDWRYVNPDNGSSVPGDYARVTADDESLIITVDVPPNRIRAMGTSRVDPTLS